MIPGAWTSFDLSESAVGFSTLACLHVYSPSEVNAHFAETNTTTY